MMQYLAGTDRAKDKSPNWYVGKPERLTRSFTDEESCPIK